MNTPEQSHTENTTREYPASHPLLLPARPALDIGRHLTQQPIDLILDRASVRLDKVVYVSIRLDCGRLRSARVLLPSKSVPTGRSDQTRDRKSVV